MAAQQIKMQENGRICVYQNQCDAGVPPAPQQGSSSLPQLLEQLQGENHLLMTSQQGPSLQNCIITG